VAVHANVLDCCPLRQDVGTFQSSKGQAAIALSLGRCSGGQFHVDVRSDLLGKR
jgi:hypothetical protein